MIIDTNDYITPAKFAKKVNASLPLVHYHAGKDKLDAVLIDGVMFIPKKALKKWPPKHDKIGRPKRNLTLN